jgi:DNA-binding MarR family transcriptional regulator
VNRTVTRIERDQLDAAFKAHFAAASVLFPLRVELWEARGLTLGQLRLMVLIDREDGLPLGELAQQMGVSPATITGITERLVRKGLIERRSDPSDRRLIRVVLTPAGSDAVHDISRIGNRLLARIFREMGEKDLRAYVAALTRFSDAASVVQSAG